MARVLIVEDDEVIADGMARHLEAGGFDAVSYRLLAGGIVALHVGAAKPPVREGDQGRGPREVSPASMRPSF